MTPMQLCLFLSIFGIIAFAVLVGLALVLRHITLWYFRINEVVDLLERTHGELAKLNQKSDPPDPTAKLFRALGMDG